MSTGAVHYREARLKNGFWQEFEDFTACGTKTLTEASFVCRRRIVYRAIHEETGGPVRAALWSEPHRVIVLTLPPERGDWGKWTVGDVPLDELAEYVPGTSPEGECPECRQVRDSLPPTTYQWEGDGAVLGYRYSDGRVEPYGMKHRNNEWQIMYGGPALLVDTDGRLRIYRKSAQTK